MRRIEKIFSLPKVKFYILWFEILRLYNILWIMSDSDTPSEYPHDEASGLTVQHKYSKRTMTMAS